MSKLNSLGYQYEKAARDEGGFAFPTYGHAEEGRLVAEHALLSQYDCTLLLAC